MSDQMQPEENKDSSFEHPDESHVVGSAPKSDFRRGYDNARARTERYRGPILRNARRIGVVVGSVIVLVLGGVYGFGWQNTFSYVVSYPLPLPAATVDGSPLWYRDYVEQVNYLEAVSTFRNGRIEESSQINHQAVGDLISRKVIRNAAEKHEVSVPESEVDARLQSTYAERTTLGKLMNQAGVSDDILKQRVRTNVMRENLQEKLSEQGALKNEQRFNVWLAENVHNSRITYWLPQLMR